MTNAELIAELRGHIREVHLTLLHDAADALEELQQIADHYEQTAKDYWKEACDYKQRIAELESQAAFFDAEKQNYQENIEYRDERIKELEAQLPKEGEWIEVDDWLQIPQEERGTYRCSACGQVMKYPWNFCPNCGARMQTVTDCHALESER